MIDIFAGIFELIGIWRLGNKKRDSFVFFIICNILWIIAGIYYKMYGLLIVVIPAFFINIRNFKKWKNIK